MYLDIMAVWEKSKYIIYEISFFMNVISDKGLKYMSEMSKYNEWNPNTRPAGELC